MEGRRGIYISDSKPSSYIEGSVDNMMQVIVEDTLHDQIDDHNVIDALRVIVPYNGKQGNIVCIMVGQLHDGLMCAMVVQTMPWRSY